MIVLDTKISNAKVKTLTKVDERLMSALMRVEVLAHTHPWTYDNVKACFNENMHCLNFALYQQKDLIGFSIISVVYDEAELWTIGVIPSKQGQGFGRYLLRSSLSVAALCQCKKCYLEVRESNEVAQNLYKSEGFIQVGLRKNYYEATNGMPAENALVMSLDIDYKHYENLKIEGEIKELSKFMPSAF